MKKETTIQQENTCKQCGKEYDKNEIARIYGTGFIDLPYCSAICYTKATTQPTPSEVNEGKYTPGKMEINCPIGDDGNDIIKTNPEYGDQKYFVFKIKNSFDVVGFLYPHSKQSDETMKANAARIVECWNGYDKLKLELEGMYTNNREGWEKAVKYEKVKDQLKADNEALKEANRELLEAVQEFLKVINRSEASQHYYGKAILIGESAISKHSINK